jgi:hypothetical protein
LSSSGSSASHNEGCGSLSRSTGDLQGTRRQENHNGVIQPRTGPSVLALPQLNSPFHPSFFRGK